MNLPNTFLERSDCLVFRSHQRPEFNAALHEAAKDPNLLITVGFDANGDSVAVIHREPCCEVQS